MFLGSIPKDLRSIVRATVSRWGVDELAVACSGNFTIERCVADLVPTLRGNDVSVYSCVLGWWLSGQPLNVKLRPEYRPELGFVERYLDGGVGTVATVMLGTQFFRAAGDCNPYWRRVLVGWENQFPAAHEKTVAKLEQVRLRLGSFDAMDCRDWLADRIGCDVPCATFPPFDRSGYESLFKGLDAALEWPEADYRVFDPKTAVDEIIGLVCDRPKWLVGFSTQPPQLDGKLRGVVQTSPRSRPIYVYASDADASLVLPHQSTEPVPAKRLQPGDRLGDRIWLAELSAGQLATLRSEYLDPRIKPAVPYLACAVMVDDVLVGAFAVGPAHDRPTTAYLTADFPVAPTDYPRLSKLIVYAALSRESRLLLQRRLHTELARIRTTAFSDHPASMKYRGVGIGEHRMRLEKRVDSEDPAFRFCLNYSAPYGRWTLQEAFEHWQVKHSREQKTPVG